MVEKSITCVVDGCNGKSARRGYCVKHYKRLMRHGDPLKGGVFRGKLELKNCKTDGCANRVKIAYLDLCNACYLRHSRKGSVSRLRKKKGSALRWICGISRGYKDCILFPFSVGLPNGDQEKAPRVVCEIFNGPSDENTGMFALHLCGNGHLGCVNPDHIIWGDQKENGRHRVIHNKYGKGHEVCSILTQTQEKFG